MSTIKEEPTGAGAVGLTMNLTGWHVYATCLRFVERTETYSVYAKPSGEEVCLAHGTGRRLVELDDLDLTQEWEAYKAANTWAFDIKDFRVLLRSKVIDPDSVDEVGFCADCAEPGYVDDLNATGTGSRVCDGCWNDNYYLCGGCEERFSSTTTTLLGVERCSQCIEEYWSYCEDCDGYYPDGSNDHNHDDCSSNGCVSPALSFSLRNDGADPLANDQRITITLGKGEIDETGIGEIRAYLRTTAYRLEDGDPDQLKLRILSDSLHELGNKVQEKRGNYTKRLSSLAYRQHHLKLTQEVLSHVGNIASSHSRPVDFEVEVTRDLNLPRAEFVHDASCWWTDYSASRCALKSNGGFGLRTFTDHPEEKHGDYTYPARAQATGRAWVMPLRIEDGQVWPTFETLEPDAFVVFNGYGTLEDYAPARILAHMAGWTYRKIGFECSPMYVNNCSGYLIAPEETTTRYTDNGIVLDLDAHSSLYFNESKELSHV